MDLLKNYQFYFLIPKNKEHPYQQEELDYIRGWIYNYKYISHEETSKQEESEDQTLASLFLSSE